MAALALALALALPLPQMGESSFLLVLLGLAGNLCHVFASSVLEQIVAVPKHPTDQGAWVGALVACAVHGLAVEPSHSID